MNKKILIAIAILLVVLAGFYFNRNKSVNVTDKEIKNNETINIGVILPTSGIVAAFGEEARKGIDSILASSTNIKLIYEDDACDPKTAVSAYKKLTELDKVKMNHPGLTPQGINAILRIALVK